MTITRLVPLSPPWAIAVTNRGPAGVGATIAVDPDVIVLAPNEPGEVENIGNATHAIFKFSLPKGGTGDIGPAPSLDIGTVTTVPNGNAADAAVEGSDGNYTLNLTIPAGPTGPPPTLDIGDVESGVTADAEITGGDGEYELNLVLPIGPPPVMLPGTVTAVDNGDPLVMTLTETGPGEYTLDIEVPEGPIGPPGTMDATVYDPTNVHDDAFDMDNMADGSTKVAMTDVERAKLGILPNIHQGTINTQAVIQEIAWATGASRWKWVLEGDASLALYFYNSSGVLIARYVWEQNGYFTTPLGIRIQDGGGNPLSIYLASTLTTGRTFALHVPDSDIDLTLPASGTLINADRVKYKAGTGVSASGASVTFNNLDCDDLLLVLDGISHNNGSNTTFRVDFSIDNGSTWPQGLVITGSNNAASLWHGIVPFTGLREGYVSCVRAPVNISANWNAPIQESSAVMNSIKMGGKVNAIKVSPTAGSFDAGMIYASQRN